jgi:hypothetical protein
LNASLERIGFVVFDFGDWVMGRKRWAPLVLLGALIHAGAGIAQPIESAPSPPASSAPTASIGVPTPYVLPPTGQVPQPAPIRDPFLDGDVAGPPGCFANVEVLLLRPHLRTHFTGNPNSVDTVQLATDGPLGTVASPLVELGYRLPEQLGEFVLGYRFEGADRTLVPSDPLGGIAEHDRLTINLIALEWRNHYPFSLPTGWDLEFNVGVHLGSISVDTRRDFGSSGNTAGQLEESVSNSMYGLGPAAGVRVSRELFVPGLTVFVRVSGTDLFSNIDQTFAETVVVGGAPTTFSSRTSNQEAVSQVTLQGGISYSPPTFNRGRIQAGYVWEEFWHVGHGDLAGQNGGDLLSQGFFVRAEWTF